MYAIVKTGGKQYRVEPGQTLLVERLPQDEGATVTLEPLLVRSEEAVFDAEALAKLEVQATIVGHLRGPKLRVFKFKPKRGYRRRTGHRQELTRIEVTSIGTAAGAAVPKPAAEVAPKPAAARQPAAASGEAAAPPKPAAARKPAAAVAATAHEETAEAKPAAVRKPAAAKAAPDGEATTAKPAAARKPAARSKQVAPAEPDATPSEEDTDGA